MTSFNESSKKSRRPHLAWSQLGERSHECQSLSDRRVEDPIWHGAGWGRGATNVNLFPTEGSKTPFGMEPVGGEEPRMSISFRQKGRRPHLAWSRLGERSHECQSLSDRRVEDPHSRLLPRKLFLRWTLVIFQRRVSC